MQPNDRGDFTDYRDEVLHPYTIAVTATITTTTMLRALASVKAYSEATRWVKGRALASVSIHREATRGVKGGRQQGLGRALAGEVKGWSGLGAARG